MKDRITLPVKKIDEAIAKGELLDLILYELWKLYNADLSFLALASLASLVKIAVQTQLDREKETGRPTQAQNLVVSLTPPVPAKVGTALWKVETSV